MSDLRPVSAETTNPNTPDTDAQTKVWHTVTLNNGQKRKVMAQDPPDAMNRVRRLLAWEAWPAKKGRVR